MIKVINDDIFAGLDKIENSSIDLMFIDPPYNLQKSYADNISDKWKSDTDYIKWLYEWLEIALTKLSPTGSIYIMNTTQNMPYIDLYLREKLHIMSRIIWHYDSSSRQARHFYGSLYEPILFAVKNKNKYTFNYEEILVTTKTGNERNLIDYRKKPPVPYNTHKVPGNVWYFPRVRYKMPEYVKHPSQKPEALLERIVLASSNPDDTILDLFAGTFSLGIVAKKNGRKYIGIELSKQYCDIGYNRLFN